MNLHSYVIILHRVHRNSQNNNVDDNEVINILQEILEIKKLQIIASMDELYIFKIIVKYFCNWFNQ
jgi:hypothetical protein